MNSISDFVEYDGSKLSAKHQVLIWSRATGYCFVAYSEVTAEQNIVAVAD